MNSDPKDVAIRVCHVAGCTGQVEIVATIEVLPPTQSHPHLRPGHEHRSRMNPERLTTDLNTKFP